MVQPSTSSGVVFSRSTSRPTMAVMSAWLGLSEAASGAAGTALPGATASPAGLPSQA